MKFFLKPKTEAQSREAGRERVEENFSFAVYLNFRN